MKHYKAPDNSLHALSDEDIERGGMDLLPPGSVEIDAIEAEQLRLACLPVFDPQIAINAEARAYLTSTDWFVIRQQETGEEIPAEVIAERRAARDRVK